MRRCYRSVALVLGGILLASNTFSNSCSLNVPDVVFAAEDTLANETSAAMIIAEVAQNEMIKVEVAEAVTSIQTGEENVETEVPAEETELEPEVVEEENENIFKLEYNDYNVLLKIVEAEAGGEDIIGKIMVANVILNRVNSDRFPNNVTDVVYQKSQFSPISDGRINTVSISQETLDAVERALNGEDYSDGAYYFRSVRCNSTWFDNNLRRVTEHGNHIFYTL